MIYGYMISEGFFSNLKKKKEEKRIRKQEEAQKNQELQKEKYKAKIKEFLDTGKDTHCYFGPDFVKYVRDELKWSEPQLKSQLNKISNNFRTFNDEIMNVFKEGENDYNFFIGYVQKLGLKDEDKVCTVYSDSDKLDVIYNARTKKFYEVYFDYKRPRIEEIPSLYKYRMIDELD